MTNLLNRFVEHINREKLFNKKDKLLLAVSGGLDSVVLCELCYQVGMDFEIAHVNFQLRGEESDGDEYFVKTIAEKYGVAAHFKKCDTTAFAEQNKLSVQVAARELRYNWFDELLRHEFDYLLTAHHRDDNIETQLMNFFRGTGISGLRGILPKAGTIIRPLLPFSKEELTGFAKENSLQWREDSSNTSDKYSRNYFRHTVIPAITKIYPEAVNNLAANIERLRDVEVLYQQAIAKQKKHLLYYKGREVHIPVLKLKKTEAIATVVYEILKEYNFHSGQVADVLQLLDAEQGKFVMSQTHRIIRNRNWLVIADNKSTDTDYVIIEEPGTIIFGGGELKLAVSDPVKFNKQFEQLDMREIKFPLTIRKWKQGDYFYPLGMKKKKKVARFLIDNKLSPTEKENTWVLETGKKIAMIAGRRIDERFKTTSSTKQVLVVEFKSSGKTEHP